MRLIWARYEDGEVGICLHGENRSDCPVIRISDDQAIRLAEDLLRLARECKASRRFDEKRS